MKKIFSFLVIILIAFTLYSCSEEAQIDIEVKVGQSMEIIGKVSRTKPLVSDEGLSRYPEYGKVLENASEEEKQAIIAENDYLRASQGSYDSMDAEGNLLKEGELTGRKLYKHTAAKGMYYGDLADDEQAVVKKITIHESREYGDYITGLYAPAGEVIKIEISEEDLEATGGIEVYVGQISSRGVVNNIWTARDFNRMPVIANVMKITEPVSYVGYHFGGPIYISNGLKDNKAGYSVTISGGVPYQHYIMGLTEKEEFETNALKTTPYFDLEIWDDGVRHSGPNMVRDLNYEDMINASQLWYKIASVSNNIPTGSLGQIGIDFLYDPFIAAGAAVAFVGRNFTNLPPSWMYESLNYDAFVEQGAWGTIHEYNHHFQRFGFAPGDEVTNNAISLISYSLFTNISSHRNVDDSRLTGWNRFTDPSRSLRETLQNSLSGTKDQNLNTYADILHSFGADVFIDAARYGNGQGGADMWYESLCEATGYDMRYYFEDVIHQSIGDEVKAKIGAKNYPMFVPIASIYQTGRSYYNGGSEIFSETVKPYKIKYGEKETINFDECIILPTDVSFEIVKVSKPSSGQMKRIESSNVYEYIPNSNTKESGKIEVELKLTHNSNAFEIENVKLIFEFVQEDKGLEITTYNYNEDTMYRNIAVAEANNFNGYESKEVNFSASNRNYFSNNSISVIEGKIYVPNDGTYRICAIGKDNMFVYFGKSKNDLKLSITIDGYANAYYEDNLNAHTDITAKKGEYIYFKAVVRSVSDNSFFELGWKLVDNTNFTKISDKYFINNNLKYKTTIFQSDYYVYLGDKFEDE